MARPRKDPALKALKGTLRKDREPKALAKADAGAIAGTPPRPMVAPVPLTERALGYFDAIAALLSAEGRASQHFGFSVALLAQRIEQAVDLQEEIKASGRTYTTMGKGGIMFRARPEVAMLSDALRHQQALLSELMLSPTAAQRIARPDKPKSNYFAEL